MIKLLARIWNWVFQVPAYRPITGRIEQSDVRFNGEGWES